MREIKLEDKVYPERLRLIPNAPNKLYVEGNLENLNTICIGVVGSRNCTQYGEKWCKRFVKELVKNNITIVSGMAVGIDAIAHKTALNYGGKTIAVLPSGLDNIYPYQNKNLYKQILNSNGTIISEYLPNVSADSKKFLERNRIVSGLSKGVLVVEAAYRSGTRVTAKLAVLQNRDVFCIPGSLDNPKSIGTNNLIKEFAKIVTEPTDILLKYGLINIENIKELSKEDKELKENIINIPKELYIVYNVIENKPTEISDIIRKSKLSNKEVMQKLTLLELDGKIKKISGNRYIKNKLQL